MGKFFRNAFEKTKEAVADAFYKGLDGAARLLRIKRKDELVLDTPATLSEEHTEPLPEGLTREEVLELTAEGKVNVSKEKNGKSYFAIVADNLFTFFNLVWAIVTLVVVAVGSYENLTFLAVVVPNLLIAIIQEIRAKVAVEKLSVTTDPKATVVRDGVLSDIHASQVVLGDVMKIELGRQVLSDCEVISGACEVNESMLTGESVAIKKQVGDRLLAGSFLVGGSVFAKVTSVGKDNYVHTLEKAAKKFRAPTSNLFRDLNSLIKVIGAVMIPMAALLAFSNWVFYKNEFSGTELVENIVLKTAGSIIGMIPAGIYLLVTLTLSLSVISLARKKTLVQDMYSIEMLASADVLCLDKTGTITDGTMHVVETLSLDGTSQDEIGRIMSYMQGAEESINATAHALAVAFGRREGNVLETVPFSSERKYSANHIEEIGVYAIGAPNFVPCEIDRECERKILDFAALGRRVLVLARLEALDGRGEAVALIAIEDRIRPNAKETIERFQSQDVTVRVISGDHPATVSSIAARVGIRNAEKYISCENLSDEELAASAEEYAVFGRVTPEQKVLLVKTLRQNGHTVAMPGDGVNDTLALKESNCAIAMADGSEVARKVAHIVLLNSDFGSLPDVVREGRRCINNVRQSAALFLMKTVFTILVSLFSVFTMSGYPFAPNNFLFLELFVIGLASVLLALEPNDKRIEGNFLDTVLIKSIPCALALFLPVLVLLLIGTFTPEISADTRNAVAMCVVTLCGFVNLIHICRPYTKWRFGVVCLVALLVGGAVTGSNFLPVDTFGFSHVIQNPHFFGWMLGLGFLFTTIIQLFREQFEKWFARAVKTDKLLAKQRPSLKERVLAAIKKRKEKREEAKDNAESRK